MSYKRSGVLQIKPRWRQMPEQRLKFQEVQYEFTAHIRDPKKNAAPAEIEDRRMEIYRGLFYRNIEGFIKRGFPVIRKLYSDENWHKMVRDFYAKHVSHSPYFRDIVGEFLFYLEYEREQQEEDPVFLYELAYYEWLEVSLNYMDAEIDWDHIDRDADLMQAVPVLTPYMNFKQYHFSVQKIQVNYQPTSPEEQPTFLLVYRNQKDKVGFMELNPMTARLVALLGENEEQTGEQLLQKLVDEMPSFKPEVIMHGGHKTLLQLRERDILLGAKIS